MELIKIGGGNVVYLVAGVDSVNCHFSHLKSRKYVIEISKEFK